jgi:hypothetical protein
MYIGFGKSSIWKDDFFRKMGNKTIGLDIQSRWASPRILDI